MYMLSDNIRSDIGKLAYLYYFFDIYIPSIDEWTFISGFYANC